MRPKGKLYGSVVRPTICGSERGEQSEYECCGIRERLDGEKTEQRYEYYVKAAGSTGVASVTDQTNRPRRCFGRAMR